MSDNITNEQAYEGLIKYYFDSPDDEKFADFDGYWQNVVSMVAQRSLGWVVITDEGYAKVVEAYNELAALGFFDAGE